MLIQLHVIMLVQKLCHKSSLKPAEIVSDVNALERNGNNHLFVGSCGASSYKSGRRMLHMFASVASSCI